MKKNNKETAAEQAEANEVKAPAKKRGKTIAVISLVAFVFIMATLQVLTRHGVIRLTRLHDFDKYGLKEPYIDNTNDGVNYKPVVKKCKLEKVHNNGLKVSDAYYIVDKENNIEQVRFRYAVASTSSKADLTKNGTRSLTDSNGNNILGIYNALTDNFEGKYRSQIVTINFADSEYTGTAGQYYKIDLAVRTTDLSASYYLYIPAEDGSFPKRKGFESDKLERPFFENPAENVQGSFNVAECKVEEASNNGIKLSNVYYITNDDMSVEQIRLRYAVADKASTVNLLLHGTVGIKDGDGNNILGIYNAQTDNYENSYRSQMITIDLTDTKYQYAQGGFFKIFFTVDTDAPLSAEYHIFVPNEDGSYSEHRDFDSDGLTAPYIIGEDEATKNFSDAQAEECEVNEEYSEGINLSKVYYITEPENNIEQIRFRYGVQDETLDINLALKGIIAIYDENGNETVYFNTVTDNFNNKRTQVVNIDFGESGYSGAQGRTFTIAIGVAGTDCTAQYTFTIPSDAPATPEVTSEAEPENTPEQ